MRYEGVLSDATAHKLILITNSLHEHIALRDWTLSGAPDAIHSWEGGEGGSIFLGGGLTSFSGGTVEVSCFSTEYKKGDYRKSRNS